MPDESVPSVVCDVCGKPKQKQECLKTKPLCKRCAQGLADKKHRARNHKERNDRQRDRYRKNAERERARVREYRKKNPEKSAATYKIWYEKNRDKKLSYRKQWRDDNLEKSRAASLAWYYKNRAQVLPKKKEQYHQNLYESRKSVRESVRGYRLRHPEASAIASRKWQLANPDKYKAAQKRKYTTNRAASLAKGHERYRRHREKLLAYKREYGKKYPERIAERNRNTKARRKGADGNHTAADVKAIWLRQKKRCAVPNCKNPIAATGNNKYHVDHIVAIANGGSNWPHNLQILCAQDNLAKRTKDDIEWANLHGLLFVK